GVVHPVAVLRRRVLQVPPAQRRLPLMGCVAVLHSVQPLTTDLRSLGERVVVLTENAAAAVRADAPAPPEVVEALRDRWLDLLTAWSRSGPVEVVTNDEFCLAECARLRAALGVAPRTPRGLDGYLDKVEMKTRLAAGGVAVPAWTAI